MLRTLTRLVALVPVIAAIALVVAGTAQAQSVKPRPAAAPAQIAALVNLNTATLAELEALPGVGAKTASRILDYRQKKGPFKKIEELMNVQGIGEKSFLKLKPQITVAGTGATSHPQ